MEDKLLNLAIKIAKEIDSVATKEWLPSDEGDLASSQSIVYHTLTKGTRGYIEKIANQINGCYEKGWFDACAVMIRRLLETLIIESFEKHSIQDKIKKDGDYLYLKDLIARTLSEPKWSLSRNTRTALPKLKDIGDKSAHSRRFNAVRGDIEDIKADLRGVVQELIYLAEFK